MRVSYYTKPPRNGHTVIMATITWDGHRLRKSTGETAPEGKWNPSKELVLGSTPHAQDTNARLSRYRAQILETFDRFRLRYHRRPTLEELAATLADTRNLDQMGVMEYVAFFVDTCTTRVNPATGRRIQPGMVANYRKLIRRLPAFATTWHRPLIWENMDVAWYRAYVEFCTVEQGLSVNTVGKDLAMIKTVMRYAYEDGHHANEFFRHRDFRIMREKAQTVYLNTDELTRLESLDLSGQPGLDRARDLFLIGCWTGLRFGDWGQLPRLMDDPTATQLRVVTAKTFEPVVVPIFDPVRRILAKYAADDFPEVISNQKFNAHLKRIGQKAGIDDLFDKGMRRGGEHIIQRKPKWHFITTHTARRSFASNLFHMGVDPAFIMRITGHTTVEQFRKYIRVENERTAAVVLDQVNAALRSTDHPR